MCRTLSFQNILALHNFSILIDWRLAGDCVMMHERQILFSFIPCSFVLSSTVKVLILQKYLMDLFND